MACESWIANKAFGTQGRSSLMLNLDLCCYCLFSSRNVLVSLKRNSILSLIVFSWLTVLTTPSIVAQEEANSRSDQDQEFFDPVKQDIEGWTVFVEPVMVGDSQTAKDQLALKMLGNHLQRIKIVVPDSAIPKLQEIPIWIERNHPRSETMCYHPSKAWLKSNSHDPRLAKCVHVTQAYELFSRQQMLKHPAVILHELAHGYHDQFLGFENAQVEAVYQKAKASGSYESVMDHRGETVRHYGLNNAKEYFAESTEALFYRNDFYPFVQGELKEHDPAMFELLTELWNPKD